MWKFFRNLVFHLSAETAHHLGIWALKQTPIAKKTISLPPSREKEWFLSASNPIGLAAGMDKNGEVIGALPRFGFGFAEIGTVTPRPQGGNEKPRLFREPETGSLFNCLGFNNFGAHLVAENLRRIKPQIPSGFPVGVNLGKNKTTSEADAVHDYRSVADSFADIADYFVINVSSPNTPGLRSLQTADALIPIVKAVQNVCELRKRMIPVLVKLAPELSLPERQDQFADLLYRLRQEKVSGLVLTNTWMGSFETEAKNLTGGWSGGRLKEKSREALRIAKVMTDLPIISVGGIDSADEIKLRLEMGAHLVQIYTSWVYQGPFFPKQCLKSIGKDYRPKP